MGQPAGVIVSEVSEPQPVAQVRPRPNRPNHDEFGPGEVSFLPPGHDAWVVGSEPVVLLDISGMADYAKKA